MTVEHKLRSVPPQRVKRRTRHKPAPDASCSSSATKQLESPFTASEKRELLKGIHNVTNILPVEIPMPGAVASCSKKSWIQQGTTVTQDDAAALVLLLMWTTDKKSAP